MLVLKLTDKDRKAYGGFQWPDSGPVECPDWDPKPACGGGLHGWGRGEGNYCHSPNDGTWLVVDVHDELVIGLGDKIKFPRGTVVHCGTRVSAVKYLIDNGALTAASNPAWACLTPAQCVEVAMRAADRTVRKHAPKRLRARGLVEAAERLEALPQIKDLESALKAKSASDAAYAASAADAAASAADAADAAASAASAADAAEREAQRLDKIELLGLR